jgi:glycine dehydrogenase subunit 1
MRYLPHTQQDIQNMLQVIGASSLEDLFATIPDRSCRLGDLDLPGPMSEWDLRRHMAELASGTVHSEQAKVFLGAGNYEHYIPSALRHLVSRSEFYTAYTPYQPEVSQGTLQGVFEYQTLISRLMGLEVSNASVYDGASALSEALLMTLRINKKRSRVAVSRAIHPHYRKILATYFEPLDVEMVELPYTADGLTDTSGLERIEDLAAVAVQSPNFFGCIEPIGVVAEAAHDLGALMVTCFSEALAYGLLEGPGTLGADVACGEGQSLGIPQSFGGPGLGIFCARKKHVRNLPGRLIGQTHDRDGRRGFVMTLSTREQHIRREKATSNICSNQNLCAIMAAIYMACLGGSGMRELAQLNLDKAQYLKQQLRDAGASIPFSSPTFNEFVVRYPGNGASLTDRLAAKNIVPGLPLDEHYPELAGHHLVSVTETKSKEDLDQLVKEVTA